MSIFYFGFYTNNSNPNDFVAFPGCNTKMSYILKSIKKNNIPVNVICLGESFKFHKSKSFKVDEFETDFFVATIPTRILSKLFLWLQVLYYLLFVVKKNDTVIFYHSLFILPIFKFVRFFKKFKFILEVEESYCAAWGKSEYWVRREISLLKGADAYIYVNDLLPYFVSNEKPYLVCYGSYDQSKVIIKDLNYNNKNIVYAGMISKNDNSDVYLAIDSFSLLDKSYVLHVLGYGSEKSIMDMLKYIDDNGLSQRVIYGGFLNGNELIKYLQKCSIALNPRVLKNNLSNYTFPSKVLTYLNNGLPVVSTPIECIMSSKIENLVIFSKNNKPEEFARAIKNVQFGTSPSLAIKNLNRDFVNRIGSLLKNDSN